MATIRGGICKTRLHSLITNHADAKPKLKERRGNPSFLTLSPSFSPSPTSLSVVCHFSNGGGIPPESRDQRAGFQEPPTVHQLVLSGDLVALRKKLQEKPSLIHDRNALYRQTPLHMAAKNGRSEAVKVLLDHGAYAEAKDNNGMTPLHVAVCYAYRAAYFPTIECNADHYLTVKTLLEYNADCSVKDNEGYTPVDHLSLGPQGEKLQELFHLHIEQKRRHEAVEARGDMKENMDKIEETLANLVGLHELKLQLRKWAKGMVLDEKRRALGLTVAARKPPHMAFLGNPGTGKTMVARILGRLLYVVGILPTDIVTEVQRSDLVGEYIGYTGPKTRKKIKEAEGGILFVDEAYRLIPRMNSDDKDYGLEALEEIMSVMDSGKVVVIFAGYSEPMKRVISSNEGFRRRVTKFFYFSDFSSQELAQILHLKLKNQEEDSSLYGFKLHPSCTLDAITNLIEKGTTEQQRKAMNGGLIDPLLVNARENLDLRLDSYSADADELITITLKDLEAGLQSLSQ